MSSLVDLETGQRNTTESKSGEICLTLSDGLGPIDGSNVMTHPNHLMPISDDENYFISFYHKKTNSESAVSATLTITEWDIDKKYIGELVTTETYSSSTS